MKIFLKIEDKHFDYNYPLNEKPIFEMKDAKFGTIIQKGKRFFSLCSII